MSTKIICIIFFTVLLPAAVLSKKCHYCVGVSNVYCAPIKLMECADLPCMKKLTTGKGITRSELGCGPEPEKGKPPEEMNCGSETKNGITVDTCYCNESGCNRSHVNKFPSVFCIIFGLIAVLLCLRF